MITLINILPNAWIAFLLKKACTLSFSKNTFTGKIHYTCLNTLNNVLYIKSIKRMHNDPSILLIAEEEMYDYFIQIKESSTN